MKMQVWKGFAVAATLACVALSLPAEAAQKRKQSGRNTFESEISRTTSAIGDAAGHQLVHATSIFSQTSSDPDFQGTVIRDFNQADEVNGNGKSRGYSDQTHKGGDKTFWEYESTHKTLTKPDGSWEVTSEARYRAVGGTGKFKGIKGGGTATCSFTAEGGHCDWQGEHEY
jgi:hypothetical protein